MVLAYLHWVLSMYLPYATATSTFSGPAVWTHGGVGGVGGVLLFASECLFVSLASVGKVHD